MTLDNRFKALLWSNIVTLLGAVAAIIWNTAILTTEFAAVKKEQERQALVQAAVVVEQAHIEERMNASDHTQVVLDGRVFRLEELQLSRTR